MDGNGQTMITVSARCACHKYHQHKIGDHHMSTQFETGQTVYWTRIPAGRFTVRHINPDGSVALFGGEQGYQSYRDARPDEIGSTPMTGLEQIAHYAQTHLFAEVTAPELADRFSLTLSAVRRYIADHPDTFRRIGHGVYEIRDADADRNADR